MSKHLYQLTEQLIGVLDSCDEGELSDTDLAVIESLKWDYNEKIEAICKVVRMLQNMEAGARDEAERLLALAKVRANNIGRLKLFVKSSFERLGRTKLETELFKVWIQHNGQPSVILTVPPEKLPLWAQRTRIEADREVLLKEWKESGGRTPEGVEIQQGTHLRIS